MESAPTVNWATSRLRWNERLPPYTVGEGLGPPDIEQFNRNKRADMESAPTVNWATPRLRWNGQLPPYTVGTGVPDGPP